MSCDNSQPTKKIGQLVFNDNIFIGEIAQVSYNPAIGASYSLSGIIDSKGFCIVQVTPTPTPSITPTITPSITPSMTVTPTITPTKSVTPTITPTITRTPTVTPTKTATPTPTPSRSH